jgi:hypothetical protein
MSKSFNSGGFFDSFRPKNWKVNKLKFWTEIVFGDSGTIYENLDEN